MDLEAGRGVDVEPLTQARPTKSAGSSKLWGLAGGSEGDMRWQQRQGSSEARGLQRKPLQ